MKLPLNLLVYFLCFSILSMDFVCIILRFCLPPGISNFSKLNPIQVFDSFLAIFLLVLRVCLHHIPSFLVLSLCFRRFKFTNIQSPINFCQIWQLCVHVPPRFVRFPLRMTFNSELYPKMCNSRPQTRTQTAGGERKTSFWIATNKFGRGNDAVET